MHTQTRINRFAEGIKMPQDHKAKTSKKGKAKKGKKAGKKVTPAYRGKHALPYSQTRENNTGLAAYAGRHVLVDPLQFRRQWALDNGIMLVGQALDEVDAWVGYFEAHEPEEADREEAAFIAHLRELNEQDGFRQIIEASLGPVEVLS